MLTYNKLKLLILNLITELKALKAGHEYFFITIMTTFFISANFLKRSSNVIKGKIGVALPHILLNRRVCYKQ